jgi:3-oxoacyl-[acyl-carrier-protein] synthase III
VRLSPPLASAPAVAAAVVRLPAGRDRAAAAVAAGRLDQDTADRLSYDALACGGDAPVVMGAAAAHDALAQANWRGEDLDLVVHASTYDQGNDLWSPSSFIAREIGAQHAIALSVQQMSNGAAAAIEVAVSRMMADPSVARCLVTTADRFPAPGFDRWCSDYDVGYGDGATALLLGREHASWRLIAATSIGNARHEAMHRGADNVDRRDAVVDVRRRKREFAQTGAMPEFKTALREAVTAVLCAALSDAGVKADDPRVRCLALPRIGVRTRGEFYDPAIVAAGLDHADVLDFGRGTGHLGAGDIIANLADVRASYPMSTGDIALFLGVGAGFTWSCLVVEHV